MVEGEELGAIARRVIDPDRFMTIGTAPGRRFCRPGVAGEQVASWLHGHGRCARGRGRRARTPPRRTEHAGASRLFMHPSS
jgi:hypothetical protein